MEYSSRPGEHVPELFGGSGSTLIAAEQVGRKAFLMELDTLYVDVIVDRYVQFVGSDEHVHLHRDGIVLHYQEVVPCSPKLPFLLRGKQHSSVWRLPETVASSLRCEAAPRDAILGAFNVTIPQVSSHQPKPSGNKFVSKIDCCSCGQKFRVEFADHDEVQRFRQETEAAAHPEHPGIVPIFEVGVHEGYHYFTMAYITGQS